MPYVVEVRGAGGSWVQKRERHGTQAEAELAVRLVREWGEEARLVGGRDGKRGGGGRGQGGWWGSGRRTCRRTVMAGWADPSRPADAGSLGRASPRYAASLTCGCVPPGAYPQEAASQPQKSLSIKETPPPRWHIRHFGWRLCHFGTRRPQGVT